MISSFSCESQRPVCRSSGVTIDPADLASQGAPKFPLSDARRKDIGVRKV